MTDAQKIDPKRAALLVMDYQPGILGRYPDADALVERAQAAIAAARAAEVPVAFVRVGFAPEDLEAMPETSKMAERAKPAGDKMGPDAPGTQVDERLDPGAEDIVVRKTRIGAFGTTDLDQQLRERGIDTLLLAGFSSSGVVLSTVRDGHDRDFRQIVISDACADPDPEVHALLMEKVFPKQAEVVEIADLEGLLS